MTIRRKFILWNLGLLVGVFASIFMAPENTPVWLWAIICAAVIGIMNCLAVARLRNRHPKPPNDATGSRVIVATGFVVFLVILIFRLTHRTP